MARPVSLHWFRQDLRLADNPALTAAAQDGAVIPVYILDDYHAGDHKMGGASRWWLHHSLHALNDSLDGKLVVLRVIQQRILPHWRRSAGLFQYIGIAVTNLGALPVTPR